MQPDVPGGSMDGSDYPLFSHDEKTIIDSPNVSHETGGAGGLLLLPDSKLGNYHILNLIGTGTMGEVWVAFDPDANREVVVKVLHREYTQEIVQVQRFDNLANILSEIDHPCVLKVYSSGRDQDFFFFVMEWARSSLSQKLHRKGTLALAEANMFMQRTVEGLAHAAEHNLVHGDVRPANIMLLRGGGVKLGDFGITRIARENMTASSPEFPITGVDYLSPEAVTNSRLDIRSDMYSLGISYYQMLTGRVPFKGTTAQIMDQHLNAPLPDRADFASRHGKGVAEIIARLTAKNPSDRFQTYDEVLSVLNSIEEHGADSNPYPFDSSSSSYSGFEVLYAEEISSQISPALARHPAEESPVVVPEPVHNNDLEETPLDTPVVFPEVAPASATPDSSHDDSSDMRVDASSARRDQSDTSDSGHSVASAYVVSENSPNVTGSAYSVHAPGDVYALPATSQSSQYPALISRSRKPLIILGITGVVLLFGGLGAYMLFHKDPSESPQPTESPFVAVQPPKDRVSSARPFSADPARPNSSRPPQLPNLRSALDEGAESAHTSRMTAEAVPVSPVRQLAEVPAAGAAGRPIIIDDADPGAVILLPNPLAWRESSEPRRSYAGRSLITGVDGSARSATFLATIPADGTYSLYMTWVSSGEAFRSKAVPVFVHTAEGIVKTEIDQVMRGEEFQKVGDFTFKAGEAKAVVSISTDGIEPGPNMHISVDALKLVPVEP